MSSYLLMVPEQISLHIIYPPAPGGPEFSVDYSDCCMEKTGVREKNAGPEIFFCQRAIFGHREYMKTRAAVSHRVPSG